MQTCRHCVNFTWHRYYLETATGREFKMDPQCAKWLVAFPNDAATCFSYEREPGSDDELAGTSPA